MSSHSSKLCDGFSAALPIAVRSPHYTAVHTEQLPTLMVYRNHLAPFPPLQLKRGLPMRRARALVVGIIASFSSHHFVNVRHSPHSRSTRSALHEQGPIPSVVAVLSGPKKCVATQDEGKEGKGMKKVGFPGCGGMKTTSRVLNCWVV